MSMPSTLSINSLKNGNVLTAGKFWQLVFFRCLPFFFSDQPSGFAIAWKKILVRAHDIGMNPLVLQFAEKYFVIAMSIVEEVKLGNDFCQKIIVNCEQITSL